MRTIWVLTQFLLEFTEVEGGGGVILATIGSRDDGPTKEEHEESREELAKGERERGSPPPVEHNGNSAHE